jgi:hypothetical protein
MAEAVLLPIPLFPARSPLYRQYFTPEEIRRLDACPPDGVASDIYLLRTLLRRVLAAASGQRAFGRTSHSRASSQILRAFRGPILRPPGPGTGGRRHSFRKEAQGKLTFKQRLSMLTAFCQAALTLAALARIHWQSSDHGPESDPLLAALAVNDLSEL